MLLVFTSRSCLLYKKKMVQEEHVFLPHKTKTLFSRMKTIYSSCKKKMRSCANVEKFMNAPLVPAKVACLSASRACRGYLRNCAQSRTCHGPLYVDVAYVPRASGVSWPFHISRTSSSA